MKIHKMQQLSPEWWEARRGIPTASAFDRILTPTGRPSAQADDYMNELVADTISLEPNFFSDRPMTRAMEIGRETEPEARRWYQMTYPDHQVYQVGLCLTDDGSIGCSPDFLVGDEGVGELKCCLLKTHIGYLRKGVLPTEYRPQVHGHLLVTGRKWCDFVSYAIGAPPLVVRVVPDEYTELLRKEVGRFVEAYKRTLDMIRGMA